jgi:hypothetical protein
VITSRTLPWWLLVIGGSALTVMTWLTWAAISVWRALP